MKENIKKNLDEVIAKIKVNSKDQHYADILIKTLLSLKGQLDVEPTLIHLPVSEVVSQMEGDSFRIAICKSGEAVYHMKGGMDIVVQPKANSLYNWLTDITVVQDRLDELEEKDREILMNDVIASTYVLNIPFLAFGDLELKYKLCNIIIDYLSELQQKAIDEAELQDETPVANAEFEEATMALEGTLKEVDNGEKNDIP